jgi:uncharacterized membrane protein
MSYAALKLLHVVGAVLFLGSLLLCGWWKRRAESDASVAVVTFTLDTIAAADTRFTASGALLLLIGGGGLLASFGGETVTPAWLSGGILLFLLAALAWAVGLLPLQRQLRRALRDAGQGALPEAYHRPGRYWTWTSNAATLAAFAGLLLMVLRPGG